MRKITGKRKRLMKILAEVNKKNTFLAARCLSAWFICGLLLLCLLFPHATASAATVAANTGHISGKLLNGSQNNGPVAHQSVTLQMATGNTARDLITLTTDAQGNYAFSALQTDASVQYAIYTLYQGAQYFTDLIDLSKKADQQVNLTVYDATTSAANIAVVQTSILLDKPNPQSGMLAVSEDFFFENLGRTTYVGQVDAGQGKPDALRFSLPVGARFLSLGTGFDGYTSTQVNTGFVTNAAVLPGTSRFSFSFQVPYSGTGYHFVYQAVYPTVALSLLTPTNIQTTPRGLTPKGPTNTKSNTYNLFQTQKLGAGQSIEAQLVGLPLATEATQSPVTLNPALLWLVALLIVLMALTGLGGYLYHTRRRKAAGSKRQRNMPAGKGTVPASVTRKKVAPVVSKEALLEEIVELDKAYEAHKLKKTVYQERRAQLKARVRGLMSKAEDSERGEIGRKAARSGGKEER